MMDYDDFLKSKLIAERFGEAQAIFESMDTTSNFGYLQVILGDFYDYIQDLEGKIFFNQTDQMISRPDKSVSTSFSSDRPVSKENLEKIMPSAPKTEEISSSAALEIETDEEDPWFGFSK